MIFLLNCRRQMTNHEVVKPLAYLFQPAENKRLKISRNNNSDLQSVILEVHKKFTKNDDLYYISL